MAETEATTTKTGHAGNANTSSPRRSLVAKTSSCRVDPVCPLETGSGGRPTEHSMVSTV